MGGVACLRSRRCGLPLEPISQAGGELGGGGAAEGYELVFGGAAGAVGEKAGDGGGEGFVGGEDGNGEAEERDGAVGVVGEIGERMAIEADFFQEGVEAGAGFPDGAAFAGEGMLTEKARGVLRRGVGEEEEGAGLGVGIDAEVAAFHEHAGAVGEDGEALVGVGGFGFEEGQAGGGEAGLSAHEDATAEGEQATVVVEVLELGDGAAEVEAEGGLAALEEVFRLEGADEFVGGVEAQSGGGGDLGDGAAALGAGDDVEDARGALDGLVEGVSGHRGEFFGAHETHEKTRKSEAKEAGGKWKWKRRR